MKKSIHLLFFEGWGGGGPDFSFCRSGELHAFFWSVSSLPSSEEEEEIVRSSVLSLAKRVRQEVFLLTEG